MEIKTKLLFAIEEDLRSFVHGECPDDLNQFTEMIDWHMGWSPSTINPVVGKRLRPIFLLLITQLAGGKWHDALPAATAVELIHNFTLIHDDIQDDSDTRHNRPTIWKKYGIPQAINTGDALHSLGKMSLNRLKINYPLDAVFEISQLIERTVFQLTIGQHMDMAFQTRTAITQKDYVKMVEGKTAALLRTCFGTGYLLGCRDKRDFMLVSKIGADIGIAFQIQDDYLGIWGDPLRTGKSALIDLRSRKVTLPVVLSLTRQERFRQLWQSNYTDDDTLQEMKYLMEIDGSDKLTNELSGQYLNNALSLLQKYSSSSDEYSLLLFTLVQDLFNRNY